MIITPQIYSKVKRMTMSQMDAYLQQVAYNGFKDGVKASEDAEEEERRNTAYIGSEELRELLMGIKGIGERRADAIIGAIQGRCDGNA